MTERPILFSAPMVRALLAGTKTQTRRIVKPQPEWTEPATVWHHGAGHSGPGWYAYNEDYPEEGALHYRCHCGQPGDRLWVRETHYAWGHWTMRHNPNKGREEWHFVDETLGAGRAYRYDADNHQPRRKRDLHEIGWWKRPAIFMQRAACRITLEVTGVRVERLQAISNEDARAEGVMPDYADQCASLGHPYNAIPLFRSLWASINGPESWDANPWVWVLEFHRLAEGEAA